MFAIRERIRDGPSGPSRPSLIMVCLFLDDLTAELLPDEIAHLAKSRQEFEQQSVMLAQHLFLTLNFSAESVENIGYRDLRLALMRIERGSGPAQAHGFTEQLPRHHGRFASGLLAIAQKPILVILP